MSQLLDPIHLRSIIAVADCGGFSRAATALHVSQSTISQHVRSLERAIGQTVVEKDGRQTRFTPAGERLLTEARHLLTVHDQAIERLTDASDRTIVIGSTETAVDQILPEILAALHSAYPNRHVQFSIDRSTQISQAVAKGNLDLAVGLGFPGDDAGQQVGSSELGWYGADHITAPLPGDEVALVAYFEPCGMRQRALAALAEAGYRVNVVAESTSLEGVIAATRAGLGISVLPYDHRAPHGLVQLRGLPPLGEIGVNLQFRRGLDPALAKVAKHALDELFTRKRRIQSDTESSNSAIGNDRESSALTHSV